MANPLDIWRGSWSRSPFRELSRMQSAIDEMFEKMPELQNAKNSFPFAPSCEVSEEANQYLMKFDLPGVPKDQVKIEVHDNQLTVSAERKEEKKSDSKKKHYSEINYGSYSRTFNLPAAIDEKKVEARFENGVLTIAVPKTETNKSKQIPVL